MSKYHFHVAFLFVSLLTYPLMANILSVESYSFELNQEIYGEYIDFIEFIEMEPMYFTNSISGTGSGEFIFNEMAFTTISTSYVYGSISPFKVTTTAWPALVGVASSEARAEWVFKTNEESLLMSTQSIIGMYSASGGSYAEMSLMLLDLNSNEILKNYSYIGDCLQGYKEINKSFNCSFLIDGFKQDHEYLLIMRSYSLGLEWGSVNLNQFSISFDRVSVPEPDSFFMMLSGIFLVGIFGKYGKKRST